jgi:DNA helicase-2/ATP-dependent DNA helicase PcrA
VGKAGSSIAGFVRLIEHLRDATKHNTLPETVEYVIQHSGLIQHYLSEREGQDRVENLQELINAATAFVAEEGYGQDVQAATPPGEDQAGVEDISPLAGFLAHASLEAGDNQAEAGQDAIQLMTVHSAKGLEFSAVFMTGLEEGLFPHENSIAEPHGLEEERRLMYVAITRAKERLYLSHTQSRMLHGQVRYNMPSRFLDELPAENVKYLTPKAKDARWGGGSWQKGTTLKKSDEDSVDQAWWSGDDVPIRDDTNQSTNAIVTSAKQLEQNKKRGHTFRVGQEVFHTKFGEGRVSALEGEGLDAKAQVNFKRHGAKWLQLSIAKLVAVES